MRLLIYYLKIVLIIHTFLISEYSVSILSMRHGLDNINGIPRENDFKYIT